MSFVSPHEDKLLNEWVNILQIQADLFADKEINLLSCFGLSKCCGPILDLGCGTGAYTVKLQHHYAQSKIVATDINTRLLSECGKRNSLNSNPNISILKWDTENELAPSAVKECRAAILRLVLQHIEDPVRFLSIVRDNLTKGSYIYVIEEDDALFQIDPNLSAFYRIIEAWYGYGVKYSRDRYMGRSVPRYMTDAGLKVVHSEYLSHTNIDIGIDKIIEFFIATANMINTADSSIISKDEIKDIEEQFSNFKKEWQDRCLIVYPQIVTVAEVL